MIGMNNELVRFSADGMVVVGVNFALKSNIISKRLAEWGVTINNAGGLAKPDASTTTPTPPVEIQSPKAVMPKQSAIKPEDTKQPAADHQPMVEKPSSSMHTPKRPYDEDDIFKTTRELEDLMDEMRNKVH
jgi:hypothetical protein